MKCRVCDSTDLELAIDLHDQPWGNHFLRKEEVGKEPFYPLQLCFCHHCKTAQLNYTVKKEVMFGDTTYLSGTTKMLRDHFYETAKYVDDTFFKQKIRKAALDIGSNDGTQLRQYQKLGYDVLGVESSRRVADIASASHVPTLQAFFNLDLAQTIRLRFDVINAAGVFFHLEELHSVTEAIKYLLKSEGVFVVQFLYMKSIMDNCAFDQIYHEHLLYYTLETLDVLLRQHGLSLFDAYLSPIHGGSMIGFVSHKESRPRTNRLEEYCRQERIAGTNTFVAYRDLAKDAEVLKQKNIDYLSQRKREGKQIYGMGAPCKGNTLLNYFGIGTQYLDCLVEKNRFRDRLFSPGMHLPIRMEDELEAPPDIYYVLAWNFKKEILKNNQHLTNTEFYFPIDV
ncbi:MAG: class I SAM-dependent methyltransferase [Chlamydiales bacterium]